MFISQDVMVFNVETILMYIGFLIFNNLSKDSILNHISGVRSQLKWYGLSDCLLDHHRVKLMIRAANRTIRAAPKIKGLFHLDNMKHIILSATTYPHPLVFSTV